MWQSWVEIEHYSVVHFNYITAFQALQHRTFVKGGLICARMNPALNGSSVLQRLECSNVIEMHNRIMFNFYLGLPYTAIPD